MKKISLLIIVFAFSGLMSTVNAQNFDNAADYMEYITKFHTKIKKDMWNYTAAIAHGKGARKVENKRKELIETTDKSLKKVKAMGPWDYSTEYRDSVAAYLEICSIVLKEDFAKIVDMEEIAERSYDDMEAYLMAKEAANDKLDEAGEMVEAAQRKFAEENGITLVDNQSKIDEKLEKSGPVFDYYTVIYLIFFKAYIQEMYMLEAIGAGDVNAAEQSKSAMITYSDEGIAKLDTMSAYKGDMTLRSACTKYLEFTKEEGEEHIPIILDFFLKKENFEKQKEIFDDIPERKRTQDDVDIFNAAVDEYNAAIEDYNSTNEDLNSDRSRWLEKWNETVNSFLDRHIPSKR
ncbi:MAG: hypothetical protein C0592_03765 [Marinilabiliales bacterium]|nr:MAG: hypothetical protein C0592_03765 [Marinilabiliales bacterium]